MTTPKSYTTMDDLLKDKARLDALEEHILHLLRYSNPQMGGQQWSGQAHNSLRGDGAGPSYLRIHHHTLRDVADMLIGDSSDKRSSALDELTAETERLGLYGTKPSP